MKLTFAGFALAAVFSSGMQAADISTTLTVNATLTIGASISATGTATLTGIGSGTFTGSLPLSAIVGTEPANAPFIIALSGGSDTLTGNLVIPTSLFGGGTAANGSATITGGTGTYAGATGSFPTLAGTGGIEGASIKVSFTGPGTITTGGSGGPGPGTSTTVITDVLDAGSYTEKIAQGSVFVVKGSNLAPSGLKQFGFPLPTSSDGVKIAFTPASGGSEVDAFLVYTCNTDLYGCVGNKTQLAAVLPSSLAVGNYNVTVTNGTSVSAPFPVSVVQRKIGLLTQSTDGSGLATVQNYISPSQLDIDRFTAGSVGGYTISPAKPGQILIAWATGMGPVPGGDNTPSAGYDFAANGVTVKVLVGGVSITPLYAGRAPGLAGADQINFELPNNVPTGCTVPFQVSVNGVLSNPTFISIAPNGSATACVSDAFTEAQLKQFDQGGSFTVGSFDLISVSSTISGAGTFKSSSISGGFPQFSGFKLDSAAQYQAAASGTGACYVSHQVGNEDQVELGGNPQIPGRRRGHAERPRGIEYQQSGAHPRLRRQLLSLPRNRGIFDTRTGRRQHRRRHVLPGRSGRQGRGALQRLRHSRRSVDGDRRPAHSRYKEFRPDPELDGRQLLGPGADRRLSGHNHGQRVKRCL